MYIQKIIMDIDPLYLRLRTFDLYEINVLIN